MAITAEDKKYLNASGLAAVQKATEAWNKAYASGDKAGQDAAAKAAADARSNSANTVAGGYQTDSYGRYTNHISTPVQGVTTTTKSAKTNVSQPADSGNYGGTDIASQIVSMLTSGGQIDYAKLNSLASQRDAKMATDPAKYGQFEDTQTIINRYLPTAQYNEQLIAQNTALQNQLKQPQVQPNSVDSIINLLSGLAQSNTNYMGFDDAQKQAQAELNPMYSNAATVLSDEINKDMEMRGIYNSPLASGIVAEKQGALSNEQIAAIASRASELQKNKNELTLQDKQIRSNTLSSLLSSLIGREANLADITGTYNGKDTLDSQKYKSDLALQEGQLTGNYNGQPTLDSQKLDLQNKQFNLESETTKLNNALNSVATLGKVTTQEQANILGVPIGTTSYEAQNAAANRAMELQMFNKEMSYKSASLSIQKAAKSAQDMLDNFNKDMAIWETTGTSPNTPAMQYYGIAPGTPWTAGTAQEKLNEANAKIELIGAEEELNFQERASNFMTTYGVNRGVAEASLVIIDQANDYGTASQIAKANKTALASEGINLSTVDSILNKYYGVATNYTTPKVSPDSSLWDRIKDVIK